MMTFANKQAHSLGSANSDAFAETRPEPFMVRPVDESRMYRRLQLPDPNTQRPRQLLLENMTISIDMGSRKCTVGVRIPYPDNAEETQWSVQ